MHDGGRDVTQKRFLDPGESPRSHDDLIDVFSFRVLHDYHPWYPFVDDDLERRVVEVRLLESLFGPFCYNLTLLPVATARCLRRELPDRRIDDVQHDDLVPGVVLECVRERPPGVFRAVDGYQNRTVHTHTYVDGGYNDRIQFHVLGITAGRFFRTALSLVDMNEDTGTTDAPEPDTGALDGIEEVAATLLDADHAVAFTGAGVSTASGIPDFRSEGGIWDEFDPAEFHYSRFKSNPEAFWERRVDMHEVVYGRDIEPNAAHEALATLESRGVLDALITQNIDGLHRGAGSENVIELHGNAERVVCEQCGRRTDAGPVRERVDDGELPPRCEGCDGVLKPDVVLFGESLPQTAMQRAREHAREADVFLAVGSSLSVQPAASLPRTATRTGATLTVVNLEETPVSGVADYEFLADVTTVLPAIVDSAEP